MTYTKKITFVCFLCSIFLMLTSCGKTETDNITQDIKEALLLKSGVKNENHLCIVSQTDKNFFIKGVVPGEYIVLSSVVMASREIPKAEDNGAKLITIEKYEYKFYDVHNREEIKVIDVKEKLEEKPIAEEWKGYQYDGGTSIYFFQGNPYINIWFTSMPTKTSTKEENNEEMAIQLNLETEEMKVLEQTDIDQVMNDQRYYEYQRNLSVFWDMDMTEPGVSEYSLWGTNGFPNSNVAGEWEGVFVMDEDNRGTAYIEISSDCLPKQNENLYAEFPELKDYIGKKGYTAEIYLADYPSAEDIIGYILEDNQKFSFDGAILSAEDSTDGQSHDIHSFEEYYQWRKLTEDTQSLYQRIHYR